MAGRLIGAAILALATVVVPAAHADPAGDAEIVAAKAAYDRGDLRALTLLVPRTRNHVLAPYVTFWQYELSLDTLDAATMRAFVTANAGAPYADRLALDWVKAAARRGDWRGFGAEVATVNAPDDVELACAKAQYRRLREGDAVARDARMLWFTGANTPDLCEPLFTVMIGQGVITTADRIMRVRLAAEAGNLRLARTLADTLPGRERVPASVMAKAERDPAGVLAKGPYTWKDGGSHTLALFALERAARSDAAAAREPWLKVRDKLLASEREYGNGRIAYYAARQLNPDAAAWYAEADQDALNTEQRTWRVRAELRSGNWSGVAAAIAALPAAVADESAWRYWKARALAAGGKTAEAQALYARLADEFNFYGILAAEALGRRVNPVSQPLPVTDVWLADFGARPDVQRVVKLAELDLRPESLREWQVVVRGFGDDDLLRASEYARRAGLPDRSINTAERTQQRHDFALRYPTPFTAEFENAARGNAIDVTLLYGIARQESRFVPDIVSTAGAMGLMQLMPPTARWVSKQLNRTDYRPSQITDVAINSQFGAFYLKYWLARLDNQPALAAAAYNAGPGRAQAWRPAATPLEGAVWVETIPFNETRDYVKKVLANEMIYARSLSLPFVSMTDRLGTVQPKNATSATVARNG
ncbi:MAG: transglycosylase SLT domain-containing protein [Proteobacteria bacterium]|nr:transglycosylase SLT domain-containing protein [Pseudomonadota bacterium]